MGVHPERGAAVRMSKPCGHADDIRAVRDGKTGRRVAQLVRMKMVYRGAEAVEQHAGLPHP